MLKANYEKMSVPLTIDVTTGDVITPAAVISEVSTMFDSESIRVLSYPLETIIAEKLETVLSRSEANTRPRDYYDIYMLYKTRKNEIDRKVLKLAVDRTVKKRHSETAYKNSDSIIRTIENSAFLKDNWNRYCKSNPYATGIEYKEVCATLSALMEFVK